MKQRTRRILRKRLKALQDNQVFRAGVQASNALCALDEWQRAQVVMLYVAIPRELDPTLAVIHALDAGKTVLVPRIDQARNSIEAVPINTLNFEHRTTAYGIREPAAPAFTSIHAVDLILVPGLGFDTQAHRLGRGGGYYDRFLSLPDMQAMRCGFAFETQVYEPLPVEPHDIQMNLLVTEKQIRRF